MNQLQALAMNEGIRRKSKLWSPLGRVELERLTLGPWASRRRRELLELFDLIDPKIQELTAAVEQEVHKRPEAQRLMTHPGVGPITALAYVLIIGTPERFHCGKQIGTYLGMIPCEDTSAGKQRLGHISKQGNSLMRFFAGGSRPGGGTGQPALAASVHALGDASASEHCQGGHGAPDGGSFVLDVAERL